MDRPGEIEEKQSDRAGKWLLQLMLTLCEMWRILYLTFKFVNFKMLMICYIHFKMLLPILVVEKYF